MSGFEIRITDEKSEGCRITELVLGSDRERFATSLSFWSAEDCYAHWFENLGMALAGKRGILIESLDGPLEALNFVLMWVMYPVDDVVYFQEKLFKIPPDLKEIENIGDHLEELELVNEDGDRISTWSVSRKAIEDFISDRNMR